MSDRCRKFCSFFSAISLGVESPQMKILIFLMPSFSAGLMAAYIVGFHFSGLFTGHDSAGGF